MRVILESNDMDGKIERIYHISDIHIRLNSRKKEYDYVFQQLYEFLEMNVQRGNDVLVITGDILHSKIELQPECIMMTFEFLKRLSIILPTFIIAGNHDALLNNRHRVDSLTSILNGHDIKDLYYLKDTDKYKFKNIVFIVNSLLDDKEWIKGVKTGNKDELQIGLYHGSLLGWKNADGFQMTTHADKKIQDFDSMDYVLLGDIHKYQYMDQEKKRIAYAGSLISQNYGETDAYHGILEWKLNNGTHIFHKLNNPYQYEKIILLKKKHDDWIVYHNSIEKECNLKDCIFNEHANLLICMETECPDTECHIIQMFIKTKFPNVKYQWKRTFVNNDILRSLRIEGGETTDHHIVHGMTTEEQMIEVYLKEHVSCPLMREYVWKEIDRKIRENRRRDQKEWRISCIRFQNLFGYLGGINELKIGDWKGKSVIGIFGKNSSGKSSLLDIICFLLFSKISRHTMNSIPKEILHFEAKKGFGEVIFEIGNQSYQLKKHIQRNRNGKIKIEETFFLIDKERGACVELTEEQRRKTDKKIQDWIGEYRMFLFSNMSVQQGEVSFRELKPTERKDFLYRMFDFDNFSILKKEKEEELAKLSTEISVLRSHLGDSITEEHWDNRKTDLEQKKANNKDLLTNIDSQIAIVYQEILELQTLIIPIPHSSQDDNKRIEKELSMRFNEYNEKINKYNQIEQTHHQTRQITKDDLDIPSSIESRLVHRYSPLHSSCTCPEFKKVLEKVQDSVQNSKEIMTKWQQKKEQVRIIEDQTTRLNDEIKDQMTVSSFSRSTWDMKRIKSFSVSTHENEVKTIQMDIDTIVTNVFTEEIMKEWDMVWIKIEGQFKKWESLETRFSWEKRLYDKDIHIVYNLSCDACVQNPHYKERKQQEENLFRTKKELDASQDKMKEYMSSCLDYFPMLPKEESILLQYQYLEQQQKKQHRDMTRLHVLYSKKKETEKSLQEYKYQCKMLELQRLEKQLQILKQNQIKIDNEYKEFQETLQCYDTYVYIDKLWDIWKVNQKERIETEKGERESYQELVQKKTEIEYERRENDKYMKQWDKNRVYQEEIDKKNQEYRGLLKDKEDVQINIRLIERELENLEQQKKEWRERWERWKEKETIKKKLEIVIHCVDRNAIPSFLLQKNLELVEKRLNHMLESFIDKKVVFRIQDKDVVFGLECHDEQGQSICSSFMGGMEGFIVDVCFKLCLSHIACYPCCNLFFIDEGISVFDQEHMHNIQILFDFLSQIRSHVFLISHLPSIQDFVDMSIEITRSNNKSQIIFS